MGITKKKGVSTVYPFPGPGPKLNTKHQYRKLSIIIPLHFLVQLASMSAEGWREIGYRILAVTDKLMMNVVLVNC